MQEISKGKFPKEEIQMTDIMYNLLKTEVKIKMIFYLNSLLKNKWFIIIIICELVEKWSLMLDNSKVTWFNFSEK